LSYAVLPGLAMVLAGATEYTKWRDESPRAIQSAQVESVAAARQSTIKLLSYQADTVEKDLGAARDGLSGQFRDSYTALTHDVVIPGAKQRHISAVATVPAAASVSASQSRATVLLFINQSIIVGSDAPSSTASTVKVTLDKVDARWLISGFDPI
jgi:Mce-associated membrane protein